MKKPIIIFLAISAIMLFGCTQDNEQIINTPTADKQTPAATVTATPTLMPREYREISVSGSTLVEKFGVRTLEEFVRINPSYSFTYEGLGSTRGVSNANDGITQIGAVSRELKADELEHGMTQLKIGYYAIAVIIHPDNPVNNLSKDELKKIFLGEIDNWMDVGGPDEMINVFYREDGSATRGIFEQTLGIDDTLAQRDVISECSNINVYEGSGTMLAPVLSTPYSIGYINLYYAMESEEIKIISIDGYAPDYANIYSDNYLLCRPMYYVYHQENLNIAAAEYLDFVISNSGQEFAESCSFVPVR